MKLSLQGLQDIMGKGMFARSFQLYVRKQVGPLSAAQSDRELIISAQVTERGVHDASAYIEADHCYHMECDCAEKRTSWICPHAGAVLIKYAMEGISYANIEAASNRNALALLGEYSLAKPVPAQKVTLQPLLSLADGVPSLAFKIGNAQGSYIIKDIIDFSYRMENGGTAEYGTQLTFDHNPASFDEGSRFWLDLILEHTHAIEYAVKQTTRVNNSRVDLRELPLSSRDFDRVFDHMLPEGRIANRNPGGRFTLCDENPDITVSAVEDGNGAYTIKTYPPAFIIRGAEHTYAVSGVRIYRLSEEYAAAMAPLIKNTSEAANGLVFSKRDAKRFCTDVLPAVEKYTGTKELKVLEPIMPEALDVSYLIDMPERNRLTASVNFHYGDTYVDSASSEKDYPDIRRNITQEKIAINALTEFFDPPEEPGGQYQITDEEKIFDFLKSGTEKLAKSGQVFITDRLKNMNLTRPIRPAVSLKIDGGMLNFGVDTGEFPPEELSRLMKSVREKRRYYRLNDGRFMGLEGGEMNGFTQTADNLGIKDSDLEKGGAIIPLYRAMYLDSALKETNDVANVTRDAAFKRLIRDFKTVEDSDFEVPEHLEKVLRSYQKTGFRWLRTLDAYRFGGILADDMGLGKTLQVLSYLQSLKDEGKLTSASLIVCPASLVLNWGDEAQKWTPELRTCLLTSGDPRRNRIHTLAGEYDLIVTSYDLLRRDIDSHAQNQYYACILDEAQYIKNQETQSAKAVRRLNAKVRFALTGTPVENRLSELWSVFEFLMPGYLDRYSKFRDRWEKPITTDDDKAAKTGLAKLIHPFILRRMKSDVLSELPPKTEMNCYIEMDEIQRKYYLAYVQDIKEKLSSAGSNDKLKILAMLTRLRQLCCDPALCIEGYPGSSAKLEECLRMCEELKSGGHRILIFSQFTTMLSRIEKRLDEMGIKNFTLKGETPLAERSSLVKQFNAGEADVFLISLKAGGTGLNLTGADTVMHFDPWWNVSAQNQATDRCYRIGQDKSVTVYKLIAKDSIEENIIRLQDKKLSLAKVVTENADGSIMDMSIDDIKELLNND